MLADIILVDRARPSSMEKPLWGPCFRPSFTTNPDAMILASSLLYLLFLWHLCCRFRIMPGALSSEAQAFHPLSINICKKVPSRLFCVEGGLSSIAKRLGCLGLWDYRLAAMDKVH